MKLVVLLSGGIDSTVLLANRYEGGHDCLPITFNYGQTHHREITAAENIARHYRLAHRIINLPFLAGTAAITGHGVIPTGHATAVDATYVPARNLVMIAVAASIAEQHGAGAVLYGANVDDAAGYPDCRPRFLTAINDAVGYGTARGVSVSAPFVSWTKQQIIDHGHTLDAPLDLTWSCYRNNKQPCGRCGACESKKAAMT